MSYARNQSLARKLSGTIKEILGAAQSVGCSVDGHHPYHIIDDKTVVQWNAQLVKYCKGKFFNKGSLDKQKTKKKE